MSGAGPARRVVILGALSTMAEFTARLLAAEGAAIALAGRGAERLEAVADDLRLRGAAAVVVHDLDLVAEPDKAWRLAAMSASVGGADAALLFYGTLGDQAAANNDPAAVVRIATVNFTSAAEWATAAVPLLEASAHPRPVVLSVSSVAGDRGRRSNYAYGAAKGGLAIFMQGLAHRLAAGSRVRAVCVKPGFVKTAMTAHMAGSSRLWADPDQVATVIRRAMERRQPIVYTPWFWRFVMLAIRATPSRVFNRVDI